MHSMLQDLLDLGLATGDHALFGSGPLLARGWIDDASDPDVIARGAAYHILGVSLSSAGRAAEGIPIQTQAWRLGRHAPWRHDTASDLAFSHYLVRNYEASLTWGMRSLQLVSEYFQPHLILSAAYAQLGRTEEGRRHVESVLETRPDFSCARFRFRLLFVLDADRDHIIDGLLKAGLPA